MAPSLTETVTDVGEVVQEKELSNPPVLKGNEAKSKSEEAPAVQPVSETSVERRPLKLSGALDHFESFDVTPVIGREFVGVSLAKWLRAPNSYELIRDLAITIKSFHTQSLEGKC